MKWHVYFDTLLNFDSRWPTEPTEQQKFHVKVAKKEYLETLNTVRRSLVLWLIAVAVSCGPPKVVLFSVTHRRF